MGSRRPTFLAVVCVAAMVLTNRAVASPTACRAEIVKRSAKLAQTLGTLREKCERRRVEGTLAASTDCRTEAATAALVASAAQKMRADVARRCCGADGTCGTADDDAPAALGWGGACPDLGSRGCTAPIADPDDVGACLECAARAAGDATAEVVWERLAGATPGSPLALCQLALGKAAAILAKAETKALARCWGARLAGQHANVCPDPGDGRAAAAVAGAEAKARATICKACGGADRACGGGDDFTPAALGFLAQCPAITTPGGTACGGPIGTLDAVADCVVCTTAFAAQCGDRLAVTGLAPYPATCNPTPEVCATGVQCDTTFDCPAGTTCEANGTPTRWCVGAPCATAAQCPGGTVCAERCTADGCTGPRCQCPGFACGGGAVLCIDGIGGLRCEKICSQDSDCVDPWGLVCVNAGFGFGTCVGTTACQ